jgi:hypothetical protein
MGIDIMTHDCKACGGTGPSIWMSTCRSCGFLAAPCYCKLYALPVRVDPDKQRNCLGHSERPKTCPNCAPGEERRGWIYRYIRADMEEIDMGPWGTEDECKEHMDKHASFGALCDGPIRVSANYKPYKGGNR